MRCAFLPLALIALLVAAGCAVGPNYEPPQTDAPDLWHVELMKGLAEGEGNLQTWWVAFDDPTLTSLAELLRRGDTIHQMMQVTGEEGVSVEDYVT
jgi:multidrug efflux system outer membrane protein